MSKPMERRIAEALDHEIRGGQFGAGRLADLLQVDPGTVHRWCAGEVSIPAAEFLRVLQAIATRDPERALRLAARVLGYVGLDVFRAAPVAPAPGDLRNEAEDVPEAGVDLLREVRNSLADGIVSAEEQARIATAERRLVREGAEVVAVARALGTPEGALALAEVR
jgi:DNA-binding transcriptional regulator YdaS (Cro superfamily)